MKKNIVSLSMTCLLLITLMIEAVAQNFQGIATYQYSRTTKDFDLKGQDLPPEIQAMVMDRLKKEFQKEFELKFTLSESEWAEAESLKGTGGTSSDGMMVLNMGSSERTYKNTKEKISLSESNALGKAFLVQSALTDYQWKITSETKKIGQYMVTKATAIDIEEHETLTFNDEATKPETRVDTVNITAWFTSDIPVMHGPDEYWGLPGLILELQVDKSTYLCSKVVLNPEKKFTIKRPSKGTVISKKEFEQKMHERSEEFVKKSQHEFGGGAKIIKLQSGN